MPTPSDRPSSRRARRVAIVAGGAMAVTAAVALPALAATGSTDEAAPPLPALSSDPVRTLSATEAVGAWFAGASDEEKAQFALLTATDAERAQFTYLTATDAERAAFSFFVLTPEQREDFVRFTTPPPPPPEPEPVVTVYASGGWGGSYGGGGGYLDCVRGRESGGNYGAVNGSSGAGGAYQFLPSTWNNTANYAGRPDLVGVHPSQASAADQDAMAQALYQWQGGAPWAGPGC